MRLCSDYTTSLGRMFSNHEMTPQVNFLVSAARSQHKAQYAEEGGHESYMHSLLKEGGGPQKGKEELMVLELATAELKVGECKVSLAVLEH